MNIGPNSPYYTYSDEELKEAVRNVCYEREHNLIETFTKWSVGQYYALVTDYRYLNQSGKDRIEETVATLLEEMRDSPEPWLVKNNWPQSEVGQPAHDLLLITMWVGKEPHLQIVNEMISAGTFEENEGLTTRLHQVRDWVQDNVSRNQ